MPARSRRGSAASSSRRSSGTRSGTRFDSAFLIARQAKNNTRPTIASVMMLRSMSIIPPVLPPEPALNCALASFLAAELNATDVTSTESPRLGS